MKVASKIMYTIGKVINIIEIILHMIIITAGILIINLAEKIFESQSNPNKYSVDEIRNVGTLLLVIGIVFLIVAIVILVLASIAQSKLDNNKKDNAPHIVMIVIGVFGDIFYLLGGVFGLVAEEQLPSQTE